MQKVLYTFECLNNAVAQRITESSSNQAPWYYYDFALITLLELILRVRLNKKYTYWFDVLCVSHHLANQKLDKELDICYARYKGAVAVWVLDEELMWPGYHSMP